MLTLVLATIVIGSSLAGCSSGESSAVITKESFDPKNRKPIPPEALKQMEELQAKAKADAAKRGK